jgi:hypothetical protein
MKTKEDIKAYAFGYAILGLMIALPMGAWFLIRITYNDEIKIFTDALQVRHPILYPFILTVMNGLIIYLIGNLIKKGKQVEKKISIHYTYGFIVFSVCFVYCFIGLIENYINMF